MIPTRQPFDPSRPVRSGPPLFFPDERLLSSRTLSLRDGAQRVLIVEGGPYGAPFSGCGYGFFETYDPDKRVQLVDLNGEPESL